MKYILEGIIHREPRRLQTHFSDIPLVRNYRQKQTVFARDTFHIMLFKTSFEQFCMEYPSAGCEGRMTLDFDLNWPKTNVTTPFSTKITIILVYT